VREFLLVVGFTRDAVGHAETFASVSRHRLATSLTTTQDARAGVEHEAVWLHHAPPHTTPHISVMSICRASASSSKRPTHVILMRREKKWNGEHAQRC